MRITSVHACNKRQLAAVDRFSLSNILPYDNLHLVPRTPRVGTGFQVEFGQLPKILLGMEKARSTRKAARGWATRIRKELQEALEQSPPVLWRIKGKRADIEARLAVLDEAQLQVELLLEDKDLEADIEEAAGLRAVVSDVLYSADSVMKQVL